MPNFKTAKPGDLSSKTQNRKCWIFYEEGMPLLKKQSIKFDKIGRDMLILFCIKNKSNTSISGFFVIVIFRVQCVLRRFVAGHSSNVRQMITRKNHRNDAFSRLTKFIC